MMNKRQRGHNFQNWIEQWMLDNYEGAVVHNQKSVANKIPIRDKITGEMKEIWISKRNDIFGAIDLIVIIPGRKPLWIQATMDTGVTKRLQEMVTVPWPLEHCSVQLWQKRPDGVITIKKFTGSNLEDIGQIVRRKYYSLDKEISNGKSQQHTI